MNIVILRWLPVIIKWRSSSLLDIGKFFLMDPIFFCICVVFLHMASVGHWEPLGAGVLTPVVSCEPVASLGMIITRISSLVMPQTPRNSSETSRRLAVSPSDAQLSTEAMCKKTTHFGSIKKTFLIIDSFRGQ